MLQSLQHSYAMSIYHVYLQLTLLHSHLSKLDVQVHITSVLHQLFTGAMTTLSLQGCNARSSVVVWYFSIVLTWRLSSCRCFRDVKPITTLLPCHQYTSAYHTTTLPTTIC